MVESLGDYKKISEWSLELLQEIKLNPRPTLPKAYLDYKKLPIDSSKREAIKKDEKFWFREDVKNYLDKIESLENERISNIEYLEWCMKQELNDSQKESIWMKLCELKRECYWIYGKGPQINN